ncbi:hypothetical protein [Streptomyces sp. KL116D]
MTYGGTVVPGVPVVLGVMCGLVVLGVMCGLVVLGVPVSGAA